jgi:hypothetical protein
MEAPLNHIWELYADSLAQAVDDGYLSDDDLADEYVWPADLNFGKFEQDDVRKYVFERVEEIVDNVKNKGGMDTNLVAGYIFRSVLCGMLWERERIG